uniref:KIN17-like protein n=1 Tax=Oryza glumipatula TaxID=40148 RepID=A0A0D9Z9P8_9ORYZ
MGKHEFLTPKAIANRIKAKGLQKLRWYCQMCQKQCRDENGFKCHCMSESHQRQMQVFGQAPDRVVEGFSEEFLDAFLTLLRRAHRHSRIAATVVYNEFIADRHHVHMNSTRWATLTEFVKFLGREGHCKVEDTPKGWFITYIDRDSEQAVKARLKRKRIKSDLAEDERQERMIARQIERAQQSMGKTNGELGDDASPDGSEGESGSEDEYSDSENDHEGQEEDAKEANKAAGKIAIALQRAVPGPKVNPLDDKPKVKFGFEEEDEVSARDKEKEELAKKKGKDAINAEARRSALDELMKEEEKAKERSNRKDYWLCPGIVVKVMSKLLAEKGYYKQKGVVKRVIDKYVGEIEMLESKHVLRVDQDELETVIPQIGGLVRIVNGAYRGSNARLLSVDTERFCAKVQVEKGLYDGKVLKAIEIRPCKLGFFNLKVTRDYLDIEKGVNRRPLYESHPLSSFSWTTTDNMDMVLHGKKDELHDIFESALKSSDLKGLHAECLTDMWIGRDRFAFIDLSAGPFAWRPAVGGDGVRTELSLPNVAKTVGAVAVTYRWNPRKLDLYKSKVSAAKRKRNIEYTLSDSSAMAKLQKKRLKLNYKIQSEILIFWRELDERRHDLKSELEGYNTGDSDDINKKKALDALNRMEKWNLFKDVPEEHHSYTVARDSFLAHLGSVLWGSMRHVIAPSVSHRAHHYYDKLSFQLYFVTQEKVRNIKQLPVNVKSVTEVLSSVLLQFQKPMFSQHMLSLSEDPALIMAFAMARRAAAVPLLLVNGFSKSTVHTYLDSAILQHQLQRLSEHNLLKVWCWAGDSKLPELFASLYLKRSKFVFSVVCACGFFFLSFCKTLVGGCWGWLIPAPLASFFFFPA